MASSMLSGERRYVSARRGGMTVLGKIAVPKPVNLPSQRSENHGNDPNVEIVPKGTPSWGSRSSSASNAWGSTALSPPNTSGGAGSPCFTSRSSSGGSGTRPSTAGSERSHEPASKPWGSSSRPSSASGVFTSPQTSTGTRPRSAETRPGSSQLSRFAEPVSENSVAWGGSGNSEILAHPYAKVNAFSLSSGDFPTLGSEKSTESRVQEDHSSQGRPVSASEVATAKQKLEISHTDDDSIDANQGRGTPNSWRRDSSSPYDGGAAPGIMEKWQRETHPYPNSNMPPQHFDTWHGAPVHPPPDGVWYRPSGGPPYGSPGPPGPPGNYHVGAFAYYQPHLPGRPLPNSQAVPRPGSGPGGYHPRNGDSYRPQMPDSYVHPVMPVRPAVYPGPVPYDGYYCPPHVMCSSSERDAPVMGMATGPCVYGGYPVQNVHPDSGNFHVTPGGYGPTSTTMVKEHVEIGHPQGNQRGTMVKEHVETGHPQGIQRGPYKVLLKQHDAWEGSDGKEKKREQEHAVTASARPLERGSRQGTPSAWPLERGSQPGTPSARTHERGSRPGTPMKEDALGVEHRVAESEDFSKIVRGEVSSQSAQSQGSYSLAPAVLNLTERTTTTKKVDNGLMKKPERFNNKARNSEDRYEVGHVATGVVKTKPFRIVNAKVEHFTNEAISGVTPENTSIYSALTPTNDVSASAKDKRLERTFISNTVVSRSVCDSAAIVSNSSGDGEMAQSHIHKRAQGVQSSAEYRGKGRFNMQEGDEWRKKSHVPDSTQEATEKSEPNLQGRQGGESRANSTLDPIEVQRPNMREIATQRAKQLQREEEERMRELKAKALSHANSALDPIEVQRAKMREIATERAKQLQIEEEERIREQKAKALAKLEELNRRAPAESSTDKLDHPLPPSGPLDLKQESSTGPSADRSTADRLPNPAIGLKSDSVTEKNNTSRIAKSSDSLKSVPLKASVCLPQDPVVTNILPLPSPLPLEVQTADFINQRAAQPVHDTFVTKQKQMGHKRKQNIPLDKNSSDKSIPTGNIGGTQSHGNVVGDSNASSGESNIPSNTTTDDLLQQKKKNNSSSRNKHKLAEVSTSAPSLPALVPLEGPPAKASAEMSKLKVCGTVIESSGLVQAPTLKERSEGDSQDIVPSAEQVPSLPTEEAHGRVNNHWKPQAPRRMPRNTQGTRSTEKFHSNDAVVWAPVRSLNKNEASDDRSVSAKIEVQTSATNGNCVQNHQKSRRAEMERYVPKPVAKELSQQGTTQRPSSPSVNETVSNDNNNTGRAESGSLTTESSEPDSSKVGFAVVAKNGESKNSKHGKTQGLWRQRGSTESSVVHTSQEGSPLSSDESKIVHKPIKQHQSLKPDAVMKAQASDPDSWNAPSNPISTEPVTVPAVGKDRGVTSRGKRQQFKGNKVTAHSYASDPKDIHSGDTDKAARELSQSDVKTIVVESHGMVEHSSSSHWQPKSQAYSVQTQGHRAHGGQRVTNQVGRAYENEVPAQHGGRNRASRNDKDNSGAASVQSQADQPNSVVPSVRREEAKKERKHGNLANVASHSQSQGPMSSAKAAVPENIDNQNEQSFSLGPRRHGHNNGRFGRGGHEGSRGGRSSAVQDISKQQQQPANSDRRRNNSHYEYQPARSYNNEPSESFEGGSSRAMGSRYRERGGGGQTHSRHGGSNFYGWNDGAVEVGASSGGNGD